MKAYKVIWQTYKITYATNMGQLYGGSGINTLVIKDEYFITKDAALKFIAIKDKALKELELNNSQLQMPIMEEVELK